MSAESGSRPEEFKLTPQDIEDREDFEYFLSIMEKQHSLGATQLVDYKDAAAYRSGVESFMRQKPPEGRVTLLFDDIIFDFDGVLYDSTYAAYRTVELMLQEHSDGKTPVPTIDEIANSYQPPHAVYYQRFGIPLNTKKEIDAFRDAYVRLYAQVNAEHHTPATLYPEVKSVLDTIKEAKKENPRMRIHIISAGTEKHVKDVLDQAGIMQDFDQIHWNCSDKTEMIKSIANQAEDRERTAMIGDLPSDIKDAHLIPGVRSIAVARGDVERERLGLYLPDYIASDLNGLLDLKSYSRELREAEYNKENPFVLKEISEQWANSVEKEEGLWRDTVLYPAVQSWIDTLNRGDATIVDIGSGQGMTSSKISGYKKYIGVEPSPFLTERAKELYGAENRDFVVGNAYELPLPDGSVDGALSINVWFHLRDMDRASLELARVLKSGASFFINTADNDSLETWKSFYIDPVVDEEKMVGEVYVPINNLSINTFYFQPNDIVLATLKKHGLDVMRVTKTFDKDGATLFIMIEGKKL
jgi:phosphoglycolate phosphatase-like HAD superfamily hydrolase/SAM-dependent methyltransferase